MRTAISYLDFDLLIRRTDSGYRAQVLSSPAGEATADFTAPFSELELENFVLRIGRPRRGTRRIGSPEMEAVKTLGKGLYEAVFSGDVRACWRSSLSEAEAQNAGLRLRLRIADAPGLSDIPWEYLYNASLNRFLSLSEYTPLVRYLDLPEHIRPLTVDAQLEILVIISSPTDYPGLDVEHEWSRLNEALAGLVDSGQVRLERLAEARLSMLQRKLRGDEYHIVHFIGHGGFDRETQSGVLVLCDEGGKGRLVAAEHLGTILHDHRSLRLVVLNACEGSRSSRSDPFAGVAQTLVQQGVPAVIAMQFEITDQAAITFAEEFYAATADGYPVDAALSAARKAIFAVGNDIEWGTPVLYLRAPNGRLFSVNRDAKAARLAEEEKQRAEAARLAAEEKQRAEAAQLAAEEKQRAEAAQLAADEKQRAEAAQLAADEKQRAEAARLAEEKKQRAEAARLAEEEKQRAEAARLAEEEKQRAEAARPAEEEKQQAELARLAEEEKRQAEAVRESVQADWAPLLAQQTRPPEATPSAAAARKPVRADQAQLAESVPAAEQHPVEIVVGKINPPKPERNMWLLGFALLFPISVIIWVGASLETSPTTSPAASTPSSPTSPAASTPSSPTSPAASTLTSGLLVSVSNHSISIKDGDTLHSFLIGQQTVIYINGVRSDINGLQRSIGYGTRVYGNGGSADRVDLLGRTFNGMDGYIRE